MKNCKNLSLTTCVIFVGLSFFFSFCSSSKQGKVIQGKDGKIESAIIDARCSYPKKTYAKELDAKIKAEVDSLRFTPQSNFDVSFNQKVIKLHDYTAKGLDLDLLLFRVCEMANNRGFTSEQTSLLIQKAIDLWGQAEKPTSFQQTIISNNQQGGITAGNVFFQPQKRYLTSALGFDLLKKLSFINYDSLEISASMGNNESFAYATQIHDFLKVHLKDKKIDGISQVIFSIPITGTMIDTSFVTAKKQVLITVGANN